MLAPSGPAPSSARRPPTLSTSGGPTLTYPFRDSYGRSRSTELGTYQDSGFLSHDCCFDCIEIDAGTYAPTSERCVASFQGYGAMLLRGARGSRLAESWSSARRGWSGQTSGEWSQVHTNELLIWQQPLLTPCLCDQPMLVLILMLLVDRLTQAHQCRSTA